MSEYTKEELNNALNVITSTIRNCEKMQPKFNEGTSQHSLLRNRIKALQISKCLIENDESINKYNVESLENALPPVISIINKTEKAIGKHEEGSTTFKRLSPIIKSMYVAKCLITEEISKRKHD